jgi:hypothetical protein
MAITTLQVDKETADSLKELDIVTNEGIKLKTNNDKIVFLLNNYLKNKEK